MAGLFLALLVVHLLCVNVASAGPLLCAWAEWREHRGDAGKGAIGRWLSWTSVAALLLGGLAGAAAGWLQWDADYAATAARLSRRLYSGSAELVFSLALMVAHAWWWSRQPRPTGRVRAVRLVLPVLAGTNLLYHFPLLFIVVNAVRHGLVKLPETATSRDFLAIVQLPEVLPKAAHFWLASFAVAGAAVLWRSLSPAFAGPVAEIDQKSAVTWGGRLLAIPTLLQLLVGGWVFFSLRASSQTRLMTGDLVMTLLFTASLAATLWLLHLSSQLALGELSRDVRRRAILAIVVVVALMTIVSERAVS